MLFKVLLPQSSTTQKVAGHHGGRKEVILGEVGAKV